MNDQVKELVEVVTATSGARDDRWQPSVGEETLELMARLGLSGESAGRVTQEALSILGRCIAPTAKGKTSTGLAVGYVQSGKTMSFTTVAALARDNGFRIVVVLAGVSTSLLAQSTDRLANDLGISAGNRGWLLFESQRLTKAAQAGTREQLRALLDTWKSSGSLPFASMRRTALIVVMKHHQHLERVTALLNGIDLGGVPALIIDDEADQASLNAAIRKQDESRTYAKIKALRAKLPQHTYLQYTATPQAPLLLNIIDSLSPTFVEVLTPGTDYVGGRDFFLRSGSQAVREIPGTDLPGDPDAGEEIPTSLVAALQLFFVGAAAGFIADKGKGNRSMLVHPSQQRQGHSEYYGWVRNIQSLWARILQPNGHYSDDRRILLEEFEGAYRDIASTASGMPSKDELFSLLQYIIANTTIVEVNSRAGATPKINWKSNYSHVLVGGQAMDRGFTVEGLTVTYMPRTLGVANADTVQQRARFFGYKRGYFGYCRVFLEDESIDAYRKYVRHEEDMRGRLERHRDSGEPLSTWKRMFFLDSGLQPTRRSVLELNYQRTKSIIDDWFTPRAPYVNQETVEANRARIERFKRSWAKELVEDRGSPSRSDTQRHLMAEIPLVRVLEDCVLQLQFASADDSRGLTVLTLLLAELQRAYPEQLCRVYWMSKGKSRDRTVDDKGELKNLYQGAAPSAPKADVGKIYLGDRHIRAANMPTIQFHMLRVLSEEDEVLGKDVPTVAVYVPGGIANDLLIQHQPAQDR